MKRKPGLGRRWRPFPAFRSALEGLPRARALPARSQRISSGRATAACIWWGGGEAECVAGEGREGLGPRPAGGWEGGGRNGEGTCTSVAAATDAAGLSRRAGLRSGSGARAAGRGAPQWGAWCTRHARRQCPEGESLGGTTQRPNGAPLDLPPNQKTNCDSGEPCLLETSHPKHCTVASRGRRKSHGGWCPKRGVGDRIRGPHQAEQHSVPDPVRTSTPRSQRRTFAVSGKPGCLKGMTLSPNE